MPGGLARCVLLAFALVLTACSTIKLGYENLPRLAVWQADSYLSLDDDQEAALNRHAKALQRWHRQEQLPVYAEFLRRTEEQLTGQVTDEQVAEWRRTVLTAWPPLADRLAPAVAEIGVGLRPEQLAHLQQVLAKANEKAARDYLPADPAKRVEARIRRLTDRAESFLGDVSDAQRQLIRRSARTMTVNEDAWWQVRLARQKSVLDLLAYLSREKPAADVATRRSRQMLGSLFGAPAGALDAPLAASSGDGDRLTVQLLALSTPEQKRNAIRRLTGYREDFSLLAAR